MRNFPGSGITTSTLDVLLSRGLEKKIFNPPLLIVSRKLRKILNPNNTLFKMHTSDKYS